MWKPGDVGNPGNSLTVQLFLGSGSGVAGGPAGVWGCFASHLVELEIAPLGPETCLQLPSPALSPTAWPLLCPPWGWARGS